MAKTTTPSSPVMEARIAGFIYVLVIILGAYAELVGRQGVVVEGDSTATLKAIAAHQDAYRLGFLAEMLTNVLAVPVTILFWRLLTPTGPRIALIALVLDLTQNTINGVNAWTQFAPLQLLPGEDGAAGLPPGEAAALARLALHWHDAGFQIALTFFGFALVLEGWLVFRARYFPQWLGALYMLAGGCYLVSAVEFFLNLHGPAAGWSMYGSFAGEAAMALWLLIAGVDEARWREAAGA